MKAKSIKNRFAYIMKVQTLLLCFGTLVEAALKKQDLMSNLVGLLPLLFLEKSNYII